MAKPQRGFAPIVDDDVEILILGSFPSRKSLEAGEYYAHRQNQFWRLIGDVIGESLSHDLAYGERKRILLRHQVGVWDVIGACEREGSLDSSIRNQRNNDLASLRRKLKKLKRVCFNGKTAARQQPVFASMGYETLVLPSSSPAYTLPFERKLAAWRRIVGGER